MGQVLSLLNLLALWCLIIIEVRCIFDLKNEILEGNKTVHLEPLFLTPLIQAGKIKEAQQAAEVKGLPEMKDTKSYSGYLTVNKKYNSNMFFWFFPAENDPKTAPVLLWLQGGPGRSSLRGLLMENGPYDVESGTLKRRKATWTKDHSVIYLDNPVGAGFSHTNLEGYHQNLTTLGEDLYSAVLQFFQLFPDLQNNDFFIAGQSYGGKYVPTISHLIHIRNPEAKQKINLVGLAIGNGLVDPETQVQYSEFLYQIGLINLKGKKEMEAYEQKIVNLIKNKEWTAAYYTYSAMLFHSRHSVFRALTGFNTLVDFLDPNHSSAKEVHMTKYVSQPVVRKAIHAGNNSFYPYCPYIHFTLAKGIMITVAPLVSELLNHYKVLIYNGQLDIIIPYRTTVDYLRKLKFNGSENYDNAERLQWFVNKELAGYVTHVGNLTEVMVRNAGHSVPEDQIEWATDMMYRFTRSKTFSQHNVAA